METHCPECGEPKTDLDHETCEGCMPDDVWDAYRAMVDHPIPRDLMCWYCDRGRHARCALPRTCACYACYPR